MQTTTQPISAADESPPALLELKNVGRIFTRHEDGIDRLLRKVARWAPPHRVRAVDDVSLRLRKGEVVGLVGESGCGKSTLGRIAGQISKPTSGHVLIDGKDITKLSKAERIKTRLRVQMIFQDPFSSLNPRMRIGDVLAEAAVAHGIVSRGDSAAFVRQNLEQVELDGGYSDRFPHQFSGGQRQRIGIARALSVSPELLICDESVAALDVSIQAQIINLFMDLRSRLGLTYLFISHDLGVIEHISDRVVIMYLGRVIEEAPTEELFRAPNHPYTQALLRQKPRIQLGKRTFETINGEIPSPLRPPQGCHFHPRCPHVMPVCRQQAPVLREIAPGRRSACHLNTDS